MSKQRTTGAQGRSHDPQQSSPQRADSATASAIEVRGCIRLVGRKRGKSDKWDFKRCESGCTHRGRNPKGTGSSKIAVSHLLYILDLPPIGVCTYCAGEIKAFWKEFCDESVEPG